MFVVNRQFPRSQGDIWFLLAHFEGNNDQENRESVHSNFEDSKILNEFKQIT